MKFILLTVLFVFFVIAGYVIYRFYKIRYLLYFDLVYICDYLKNNISFNKDSLDVIIKNSKNNLNKSTIKIIETIDEGQVCIKYEDRENLIKFFSSIGKGDVSYELNNLNYNENYFKRLCDDAQKDVKEKGILYMKLTIILGVALVIILI